MTTTFFKMLYANKSFLNSEDIRRITLASIFIADQVLLPTNIQANPTLSDSERKFITTRLKELHEINALRFWKIEGKADEITQAVPRKAVITRPDEVIDLESYKAILEQINDRLMYQRETLLGEQATSYDGITEMVMGKQTMWKFAVAKTLQADRLLFEAEAQSTMSQFFSDLMRYHEFESLVVERIAEKLDLPDISILDMKDIETCRKYMPAFREKLINKTEDQYDQIFLELIVEEIAKAIVDEFLDLIVAQNKAILSRGKLLGKGTGIAKEASWDLLQMLFAPIIIAKYAKLFFDSQKESSEIAPLLLLIKLHQLKTKP